jgi:hypothetical protein
MPHFHVADVVRIARIVHVPDGGLGILSELMHIPSISFCH